MIEQPVRFYIGTGSQAQLVAELDMGYDADAAYRHFPGKPQDDSYPESKFRATVAELSSLYPEYCGNAEIPAWQVAYVTNAVHVFHDGYLVSHIYPHGARKQTVFPVPTGS